MQTDVLIIGQGICGSLLSWWLYKEGVPFVVIDEEIDNSASRVAAGIINPVTGRRYVKTWMAETVLPFATETYQQLGQDLQSVLLYERNILDFFSTPQMRHSFIERLTENDTYLHAYPDQNRFNESFAYDFGCGEIGPAYTVNLSLLLSAWRQKLQALSAVRTERFAAEELKLTNDGIIYGDMQARKIIFCDGISCTQNPWFSLLPFSAVKGEALIISSADLSTDHVFKKGLLLAPLAEAGLFWVGSNYVWDFDDNKPTETFYHQATSLLNQWLKLPYEVVAHKAAVRPATVERRPFVGFHPVATQVGILNGMGTKGTSLAPFFAHQLAQQIIHNLPIQRDVDIHRFLRLLSKQP